jgi:hypothetical protein
VSDVRAKLHVALGVSDIAASVGDYSRRLGCEPVVLVPGEYALWRTDTVNFSIRRAEKSAGVLRHLGWEDPAAASFTQEEDVNGITWETFTAAQQMDEIAGTWPSTSGR